jgi:hypothetical protein
METDEEGNMVTDESMKELAGILVGSFYIGDKKPHALAPPKAMAIESMYNAMKDHKEDVMLSLMRFHDWMHKHGVGIDDYQNYGRGNCMRPAGDGQVNADADGGQGSAKGDILRPVV